MVELVLGPAVADAGQHAEEVLERQRDAGPVMRLQLGQRDDQVGPAQSHRQHQLAQPGVAQGVGHGDDVVMIQVDEFQPGLG